MIYWNTLGRVTRLLPPGIQQHRIKSITGHTGNYHVMHKRGEIENNKCTNCNYNIIENHLIFSLKPTKKNIFFYLARINVELKKN